MNTFANVADAYLVATAAAKQMTLVTYEASSPFSKKRVMIPDACNALGVRYCDQNTVLKEMGIEIWLSNTLAIGRSLIRTFLASYTKDAAICLVNEEQDQKKKLSMDSVLSKFLFDFTPDAES